MTLNILKWRPTAPKLKLPTGGAIGEPDAHVFNCPKCARPLTEGTPRCPGCGTRLIMGVVLRRAGTLMGFGFVVGMFIGGVATSFVISNLLAPAAPAVAVDPADTTTAQASGVPGAPSGAANPPVVAPSGALSSLRQASLLDARFVADTKALSSAYKANATGVDIALVLRSLASDAAIGSDLLPGLRAWDDARKLAAARAGFYAAVAGISHDALRASMTDKKAYRAAAKSMLATLRKLPSLDDQSRSLAATAGATLPDVDLSVFGR